MTARRTQTPIAIVGMSALLPGSTDLAGAWRDIVAGRDLITDVPPTHWLIDDYYDANPAAPDKTYARRGAFLPTVPFDPIEFGMPPSIVPSTDSAQLLALMVAQRALEDATDGKLSTLDRDRVGCILGVTSAQELLGEMNSRLQRPVWVKALREAGLDEEQVTSICERISASYVPWSESTFPGLLGNVVAGRVANRFDLRGTNAVTDAACASSLAALSMAVNELQLGQSDLMLAGGVDTMNDIFMYVCFSKTPALSPTGDCRPFSDAADGTMLGEGVVMVALKRLADAERDGDRIYAVIKGIGSASDGRATSVYAPLPEGQARALRRSYEVAGYGPETVELVEAHGTGTKAGDAAEFQGLKLVFQAAGAATQGCALGSIKSQVGHTKAAAGAAGLVKAALALHHKVLPPTIKVERPNPKLGLDQSPFYLNTQARPWIRDASHPRRASVSAFGFGGSNFHVAVEEFVPGVGSKGRRAARIHTRPAELVVLGAASPNALVEAARGLATKAGDLSALARETQLAFDVSLAARLAIVATSKEDLAAKLAAAADAITKAPEKAYSSPAGTHYATGADAGKVAFLFPGQGSQYVGMSADLAMAFDEARQPWDRAAALRFDGCALHEVVFPRPVFTDADREAQQKKLTATEWAQPAIGAASLAMLEVLRALGVRPDAVGGHSFGEVTALHAAGVLDEEGFLRTARRRGELMRDAASVPGAMTAVSMPADELRALLAEWSSDVVLANHNSPTQAVLSGPTEAVAEVEKKLAQRGKVAKRLGVATAFHSRLVAPSCVPFAEFLGGVPFQAPSVDVYSNADAKPYPVAAADLRARLSSQIAQPVLFVAEIEAMYAAGVRTFVEVGPSSVLTELVGRILGDRPHRAVNLDRKGKHGVTSLLDGLGRLAVGGVAFSFAPLWRDVPSDAPAKKKPAMTLSIGGANYGKPYPPPGGAKALPGPNPPKPPVEARDEAPVAIAAPAPVTPPPAPTPPTDEVQLGWIRAYQEMQRQTAESHSAYQRAAAETHSAFLRATEVSLATLASMLSGQPATMPTLAALPASQAMLPVVLPAVAAPPVTVSRPVAAVKAPVAPVVVAPAAPAADIERLMLEVVAEKTGYPVTMLQLSMELEADLGIDSIKRVEILSSMRERAPGQGDVNPADLAKLRTLGQIVEHMRERLVPGAAAPMAVARVRVAASSAPAVDLEQLMLEVVAEKTGYPVAMLQLPMELEADLGIDSIKRVEILSSMRERAPGLGDVNPAELAKVRTLGQIVEHMRGRMASGPAAPVAVASVPVAAAPSAPGVDLEQLMLEVVAEKTGYPVAMLQLPMELEADLGIDSIKRVEILSSMRERAPGLGDVNPADLAKVRTLGQIVEHMRGKSASTAPVEPASAKVSAGKVRRFAVREVPAERCGLAMRGLFGVSRIAVTDDGAGVALAVAKLLATHGLPAELVTKDPAEADAVIFLGGLRAVSTVDEAMAVNREAFHAARVAASRLASSGGVFVTVQDTGGDFGLSGAQPARAWLAGVAALARTAAVEWPKASVKAIDLERAARNPESLARAIVDELLLGGSLLEVGLHADGRRTTLLSCETPFQTAAPTLDASSVVVASGGARGVTAASLVALAGATKARMVLLGRTPLAEEPAFAGAIADEAGLKRALIDEAVKRGERLSPVEAGRRVAAILAGREVRQTLARLEAAGSKVRYLAADVQDAKALSAALDEVRRTWGPVSAVVHGAGVLADKLIADKTDEQFDRVFDTKVRGLRALLEATASDPLVAICLFSSVSARAGNAGQCDYGMANEVLNAVACAERARRPACAVRAIGWGPWEGGMVTPALRAHFEREGVTLIPLAAGAQVFVEELSTRGEDAVVVVGGTAGEGALRAAGGAARETEVKVDARTHPEVGDHRVGGVPVVPVALALELLVRGARDLQPGLVVREVRDLKVLRGIKLEQFETRGDRLVVRCRESTAGGERLVEAELRGRGDVLHYAARLVVGERPAALARPPSAGVLTPWTTREATYDGHVLFHGPRFQVVRSIEGISDVALEATLEGLSARGWPSGAWRTDPALVDGALQVAVLWAERALGGATLPMAVRCSRVGVSGPIDGPVQVQVRSSSVKRERAVCDVWLSRGGAVVMTLEGVELVLRPGEPATAALPAVA